MMPVTCCAPEPSCGVNVTGVPNRATHAASIEPIRLGQVMKPPPYSQARTLYLALDVTVTFTLVASWVPSVTVNVFVLPLLSTQLTNTPAGAAPNPCAMLC